MERTYIQQIRAVLSAVADGDVDVAWLGEIDGLQPIQIFLEQFFEIIVLQLQRIEFDQHGAIGGMKVADAGDRLQLK